MGGSCDGDSTKIRRAGNSQLQVHEPTSLPTLLVAMPYPRKQLVVVAGGWLRFVGRSSSVDRRCHIAHSQDQRHSSLRDHAAAIASDMCMHPAIGCSKNPTCVISTTCTHALFETYPVPSCLMTSDAMTGAFCSTEVHAPGLVATSRRRSSPAQMRRTWSTAAGGIRVGAGTPAAISAARA